METFDRIGSVTIVVAQVHLRPSEPTPLPCCRRTAASLLDAGWVMEREEGKYSLWLLHHLFLFEAWSFRENWSRGKTAGIQMNYDKQAPSCHSGKPRGHEIRKSSNQATTVFFFSCQVSEQPVLQQVARTAQESFRMSESTLCFSHDHTSSLCLHICTRELGNEKFSA